ncbi:hypothetical protein DQ238_14680 [Geodermatophilus sp. TF02-6]|uniref:DUF6157 family protein n=1 Tax=Geodermatophilus sp. TF02-6 TaxID=2250575 RepID=UPI000DE9BDB5|nr:DUF6157 family protein [Geodermatophilus sp. TF02-6]RBY77648.1 hypothetical protein DQ238_14680 [Geodermatophilus sp. TF02-6]
MGYTNTFIAVAEDCRAGTGEVPPDRSGVPTVAAVQYALHAVDSPSYARLRADGRLTQLRAMRSRRG